MRKNSRGKLHTHKLLQTAALKSLSKAGRL